MEEAGREGADDAATRRARLLARLESWLDEALLGPGPPEGLAAEVLAEAEAESEGERPAEAGDDLHGLWAAMTVLSHEVKLQGRYFKQLHDSLGAASDRGEAAPKLRPLLDEILRLVQGSRAAEQARSRRDQQELLVDLRDRLVRGRASADAALERARAELARPSLLARILRGRRRRAAALLAAVEALREGYALGLDRLDEALGEQGVSELECLGRPFDPERMIVVDVLDTEERPQGTVVEVYLPGYLCRGELLRQARVKVARSRGRAEEDR
jgi:molecular chaperone GrpE